MARGRIDCNSIGKLKINFHMLQINVDHWCTTFCSVLISHALFAHFRLLSLSDFSLSNILYRHNSLHSGTRTIHGSSNEAYIIHDYLESWDTLFPYFLSHFQVTSCNMYTLLFLFLYIFPLTFFPAVFSLYLYTFINRYIYIDIYHFCISSRADDKYHGYQLLASICCQVRSQLAGCKQPAIIAPGRLPPADQVT